MTASRVAPAIRRWILGDAFARRLRMQVLALRPGRSRVRLRVEPWMVNVHGLTVAEAREARLGRRTAFYAMTVRTRVGTTVATCQGVVHRRLQEG